MNRTGGYTSDKKNVGGANAVRSYGLEYADAVRFNGQNRYSTTDIQPATGRLLIILILPALQYQLIRLTLMQLS